MQKNLDDRRKEDAGSFYCPNGHPQQYGKSRAKLLDEAVKELNESKQELDNFRKENTRLKCELLSFAPDCPWYLKLYAKFNR